jgi:cell division septation protein DedD
VKERLTGAIILVALIVLLVPEFLSGPVRSAPRVTAAAVTSVEEPPLRSYTINLAEDAHAHTAAHPSGPQQPAPIAATAPEADAAGTPHTAAEVPAPEPTPTPTPTPQPQAAVPAAVPPAHVPVPTPPPGPGPGSAASGGFVVQLGSFASRANAERLARQVHTQGFPVSVSQGSSGRRLYRVRVGPAKDRAAASQLATQLRASGHTGSIVPE